MKHSSLFSAEYQMRVTGIFIFYKHLFDAVRVGFLQFLRCGEARTPRDNRRLEFGRSARSRSVSPSHGAMDCQRASLLRR